MLVRRFMLTTVAVTACCLLAVSLPGRAEDSKQQPTPSGEKVAAEEPAVKDDPLSAKQDALAQRYFRFEQMLLKMHDYIKKTDPDRAELLVRAYNLGADQQNHSRMRQIVELLGGDKFGDATQRQTELVAQLKVLLKLLKSEDRMTAIEREKARIKDLLRDLRHVIGTQKDVRAGTERGDDAKKLADRQKKVAGDTKKLENKIDGQDAQRNGEGEGKLGEGKPGEGKPGEGKPGEGKPGEGKPGEGKPDEGKPDEGKPDEGKPDEGKPDEGKPDEGKPGEGKPAEGKPGEGKPGEGKPGEGKPGEGKPGEGKPGEGKPGEGKPGEGQPGESADPNRTPGREEIEQARKEMEKAIEELKKLAHDAASDHQDDALAKLQEAKEKLEEILRQLREEELELLLAALEARFQKMLAMQLIVYNGTVNLGKAPKKEWTDRHRGRTRELALSEEEIILEAYKALTLLKEEGSSVAFPEAVAQLREDMQTVARRLEREQVADLTQAVERDIIEALSELIEALQKEMEKKEQEQQEGEPPPPGEPQDPSLVDKLAELKMLRSLQMRINRRTKRLGNLIDGEQAQKPDVVEQLQRLAKRQARVQEATYDLAAGKNQ